MAERPPTPDPWTVDLVFAVTTEIDAFIAPCRALKGAPLVGSDD